MEQAFFLAIAQGHLGIARIDAKLRVIVRHGALSRWLPPEGEHCCASAPLFGMERELQALLESSGASLSLPSVQLSELEEGQRVNIVALGDPAACELTILTMADPGVGAIEALLTAERRAKQITDEKLLAETERANLQTRLNAIAQERARIARDLHDTLIQSMVGVLANIRLVLKIMPVDPQRAYQELRAAESMAREGLASARATLADMRAQAMRSVTLGAAIRDLLALMRARMEIAVTLHMDPVADDLSGPVADGFARIAEEALRNIERHARARNLDLVLRRESRDGRPFVVLVIADDGVGFLTAARRDGHFGLIGMREQAELLGGQMTVQSRPGAGVIVTVAAPQDQA